MEELYKTLSGLIIPSVSVCLGWLLNEFSHRVRKSVEEKKLIKKVIYNLLETRHQYSKVQKINTTIKLTVDKLFDFYKIDENKDFTKLEMEKMYRQKVGNFMFESVSEELTDIQKQFNIAIEDLSGIDPLSAYSLRGKNKLFDVFKIMKKSFESIQIEFPSTNDIKNKDHYENIESFLKLDMINNSIFDIEDELLYLSKKINILYWLKMRKILKDKHKSSPEDQKEEIDKYFNTLVNLPT